MKRKAQISTGGVVMFLLVIAAIILISLVFGSFYIVDAGERVVLLTWGNPDMVPRAEGFHLKVPIMQKAVKMNIQTQKYEADLTAASSDLQDVKTKIAINYHLVSEDVPIIYRDIGLSYAEKVIYPLEQEANKATTAKFTAEQLVTKREEVREEMKNILAERLRSRGIIVEEISIVDFSFSESFTQAIEAKVTAEQNALAAKNKLEQVKYEALQAVEAAKGKAEALQIEGDAIRENPQVVQLRAIEKWDGKLSLVSGGAVPLLNLNFNQTSQ